MSDPIPPVHVPFVTSWCSNGGTVTVTTPCTGMTDQECEDLHNQLVESMKVLFPENC